MNKIIPIFIIFFLSTACIKTAEQLQREKRMETIADQMGDTQGLMANLVEQMKDIQTQLNTINGRIDELEHKQGSMSNSQELKEMSESLNLLKTQQENQASQFAVIQNEMKEQRSFIEKVTSSLANVKESSTKTNKKKSAKEELEVGLTLIKKNKFDEARKQLEGLIDHEGLTPGEKNKVLHGLGKVEFFTGNHEKAMVYFSKIFTKYPKASLASSSLLFIGKSLNKMGKKDEARQAFLKVIEDYKDTKEANEARKEI